MPKLQQPTEIGQKQLCNECLEKGIEIEIHSVSKSFFDKNKGVNSTYLVWVNADDNTHRKKSGDTYVHVTEVKKPDGNATEWAKKASEIKAKYRTATDQEKLFKKNMLANHEVLKACAVSSLLDEGMTMEQLEGTATKTGRGDILHARTKEMALVDLTDAIREAASHGS
jgi:hypothetical protein